MVRQNNCNCIGGGVMHKMTRAQFNETVNKLNSVVVGLDTGRVRESVAFVFAGNIYSIYKVLGMYEAMWGVLRFLLSVFSYYRQIKRIDAKRNVVTSYSNGENQ